MICQHIFLITFLNFFFTELNGFKQLLQFNYSFVCTQLNGSKYWYVSPTVQIKISHLFTHS